MHIPNEILLCILKFLHNMDLKSSRLVSKTWSAAASVFLFEEFHVSSVQDDLEVFEAATRSPLLSTCVRHLNYDATEFIYELTKTVYILKLRHDTTYIYHIVLPGKPPIQMSMTG